MPIERTLVDKIAPAEREISETKGEVSLFALFLREDAPAKWDLIIAAPWASDQSNKTLNDIVAVLKKHISRDDLVKLSRIVLTTSTDDHVRTINRAISARHSPVEVKDVDFFGMPIKHGWIFTSTGEESPKRRA